MLEVLAVGAAVDLLTGVAFDRVVLLASTIKLMIDLMLGC